MSPARQRARKQAYAADGRPAQRNNGFQKTRTQPAVVVEVFEAQREAWGFRQPVVPGALDDRHIAGAGAGGRSRILSARALGVSFDLEMVELVPAPAVARQADSPLICAIIGYGAAADDHAAALRAAGATVKAVVGPDLNSASSFAARHGIALVHRELRPILDADDVIAVVIASPSGVHAEQSLAALKSGKHVLCEVPVGLSLVEAEAVGKAAHDEGRIAMVCHTQRYWPALVTISEVIESRALAVQHVSARLAIRRIANVGERGRVRSWVDNLLWHHGAHAVDTVLALLGDEHPDLVIGSFGRPTPGTGLDMDIALVIRSRKGALGAISLSYRSTISANDYFVITDEDAFHIDRGTLTQANGMVLVGNDRAESRRLAVASQTADFMSSVRDGRQPATGIDRILPVMHVLDRLDSQRLAGTDQ